jgi:hypothetical protein
LHVTKLIRFVVMAKFEDSGAGDISDAFRRFYIGGIVVGIVTKFFHQRLVNGFGLSGKNVGKSVIGGEADGFFFVCYCSLAGRTTKGAV